MLRSTSDIGRRGIRTSCFYHIRLDIPGRNGVYVQRRAADSGTFRRVGLHSLSKPFVPFLDGTCSCQALLCTQQLFLACRTSAHMTPAAAGCWLGTASIGITMTARVRAYWPFSILTEASFRRSWCLGQSLSIHKRSCPGGLLSMTEGASTQSSALFKGILPAHH